MDWDTSNKLINLLRTCPSENSSPFFIQQFGNSSITLLQKLQLLGLLPSVESTSFVQTNLSNPSTVIFTGNILSNGGSDISEMGVVYSHSNTTPTILDSKHIYTPNLQSGSFSIGPSVDFGFEETYARTFATNSVGTSYGNVLDLIIQLCLAKGTLITLANFTTKPIEEITYTDELMVWDFDLGQFSKAYPLWIMKAGKTQSYNLLTFSDGSTLKTIVQHRIFNQEKGAFTYPMSEDTPIGTTTFNDKGDCIQLVSKEIINEPVDYYNVITNFHINLFSNTILTSCHYNNIYPIVAMKFQKTLRSQIPYSVYAEASVPKLYYDGLRLAEQKENISSIIRHIRILEKQKL